MIPVEKASAEAKALAVLMQELSEQHYSAGWLMGMESDLWCLLCDLPSGSFSALRRGVISDLRELHIKANGWVIWGKCDDYEGPCFVTTSEWLAMFNFPGWVAPKSYQEHDKLLAVKEKSQATGEFLDWLQTKKKYVLAAYHSHNEQCYYEGDRVCDDSTERLHPVYVSIPDILAEYFGIDPNRLEDEKRDMLDTLRKQHG